MWVRGSDQKENATFEISPLSSVLTLSLGIQIPSNTQSEATSPSPASSQAADGLIPVSQSLAFCFFFPQKVILENKEAQVDLKTAPNSSPQQLAMTHL